MLPVFVNLSKTMMSSLCTPTLMATRMWCTLTTVSTTSSSILKLPRCLTIVFWCSEHRSIAVKPLDSSMSS
ncbi:hypothetical protein EAE96_010308 [Botrytis aclada]|nr:hypothetical protein EAE96_010308 [Botrytis aclada]